MPTDKPNIIVIVSDTLRAADLGCYGSEQVQTPCMDAFAAQAVRFTRAYPESLPTIPVRRALHTGRRAFPFRDYRPVKWDVVYLPGWQAIDNAEDTLAENLAGAGYQTGFVTDTLPYFAPGFNFTRGFWQWEFIRGQQQDRWKSPFSVPEQRLRRYMPPENMREDPHQLIPMHLANTAHVESEADTSTARTFTCAMQFLEDNAKGQPFYLLVDCFDPHEPWEAPTEYYERYGDPDYDGRRIVHCRYGPADKLGYTDEEIAFVRAQYCGLVSLVDTWMGKLLAKVDALGLTDDTAVFIISDHGTNFCRNPRKVIGKPGDAMYPGVMWLPLLARLPGQANGGATCNELVYNIDLTATLYELAGIESEQWLDGQSLLPLLQATDGWERREHVTCRYSHSVCYIDDRTWALGDVGGRLQEAFDMESDPECLQPLDENEARTRWQGAWQRLLEDAGGEVPEYRGMHWTDAIGEPPVRK